MLTNGTRVEYRPSDNSLFWEFRIGKLGTVTHINLEDDYECCTVLFDDEDHGVLAYIHNLVELESEPEAKLSPICFVCHKHPAEIEEYIEIASIEKMTPDDYVRQEEGTYNPESNQFACTNCYIQIGMPSSPGGWRAP